MNGVGAALGLSDELVAALIDNHWDHWRELAPALERVQQPAELESWLRKAPAARADRVLLGLAQLAAEDGLNDTDAALVLAWALMGGARVVAADLRSLSSDIDALVASQLWIEVRTFSWQTLGKVAANILARLRKHVLLDLGEYSQLRNHDRTVAGSIPFSPESLTQLIPEVWADEGWSPTDELLRALEWGCRNKVITDADRQLLLDVLATATTNPDVPTDCLFGDVVTDRVGHRWGLSGRTVRRRTKRSIERLSTAVTRAA